MCCNTGSLHVVLGKYREDMLEITQYTPVNFPSDFWL